MTRGKHYALLILTVCIHYCVFASTELKRVQFRYYTDNELTRFPEYFTGKEYTGTRLFCRSCSQKEGLYFSFPINKKLSNLSSDSIIRLSIIRLGKTEVERFTFKLPDERKGKTDLFLGLTGKDWPSADTRPLAWQIEILDSSDQLLFLKKSFLWEHD